MRKLKSVSDNHLARLVSRDDGNRPVEIVRGKNSDSIYPHITGIGAYWTTPSEKTIISYPNAYRWPKTYHCSTRGTTVGKLWLARRKNRYRIQDDNGNKLIIFSKKWKSWRFGIKYKECVVISFGLCWLIKYKNKTYHYSNRNGKTNIDLACKKAIGDWRIQRKIDREKLLFDKNASKIWVGIQDSLDSGNCRVLTLDFANKFRQQLELYSIHNKVGEIGAVRADVLLSIRDDEYTRRACMVASKRYVTV